nr:P-loop NTPase fold protein [uncultured Porphyromonas sp.]
MKQLYLFLDGRYWVNIPICLIVLICWILYSTQWTRIGKDIRWLTIAVAALIFLVYWEGGSVAYAQIIAGFTYREFITCLLLIPLILSSIQIVTHRFKREATTEKDTSGGFSNDDFDDSQISGNLKKYASHILDKLIVTNIRKHSYALGVTGSWGSGKTTFLEVLKSHVKGRAEIVIFNPWMCRTPEQVTLDFFASLRHQLSPNYRISKSIKDYARALNGISLTLFLGLSLNIHPVQGDSLYVKKKKLSDKLAELLKPVIVFIDDLDRLEREEIFEVLRLIRNTADLSNLIYVVAYDKAYVRQVLEQKNIGNALAYLEKIFPVEVCLPKVEKYLIWEVLHSDIAAQADSKEFASLLFKYINNNEDRGLILRILNTYRSAKRFARIYMLNTTYIKKELNLEIKRVDLFWLILLQVYDPKVYEVLVHDPFKLLYIEHGRWILREGIIGEAVHTQRGKYTGEKFWELETPQILTRVFGENIKTLRQSVCFIENYDKYFALNIPKGKLSINELNNLLEGNDSPEGIVKEWIKTKNISSICYHLERVPTKTLHGEELKRYLSAVLELGVSANESMRQSVKSVLASQEYKSPRAEPRSIALDWLNREVVSSDNSRLIELTLMLNRLYTASWFNNEDGEIMYSNPLIISNEDIQALLVKAMEEFLEKHPDSTTLDILDEKGDLGRLFKNCCVLTDSGSYDAYRGCTQFAFNSVIEHCSNQDSKPPLSKYKDACDRIFRKAEANIFTDSEEEDAYYPYSQEPYDWEPSSYFGSDNNLIDRFKSECFSQDEQAIDVPHSNTEAALTQEGQD